MPLNANFPVAPNLRTYLSNQETALPEIIDASIVATTTTALLSGVGGATFNLFFGNLAGQEMYAVSLYPERTRIVPGSTVRPETIASFIAHNRDLLEDPRNSVGLWYDVSQNVTFLDVTATLPERTEAVDLGKQYNQIAIFDLERLEEIQIGGAGEEIPDLTPVSLRLPPLDSSRGPQSESTMRGAANTNDSGR